MKLTTEEQKMLDGAHGRATQKAMEILVALGTIYGAEADGARHLRADRGRELR